MAGALGLSGLLAPPVASIAAAQWGPQGDYGYTEGYDRGVRAGAEDSRRGDRYQFEDEGDYRRGDAGYRSQYGNRDRYRDSFRRGFQIGYRAGYGGYGSEGGPYGPGGVARPRVDNYAYDHGMNDGYEAGLNDGRARRRFDPIGEGRYRSGDHGYNSRYGSRESYKLTYRDAFKVGYERGYDDARLYNRPRLGGLFGWF
jgi:hypothetical protein